MKRFKLLRDIKLAKENPISYAHTKTDVVPVKAMQEAYQCGIFFIVSAYTYDGVTVENSANRSKGENFKRRGLIMISTEDIRNKEVINICDGTSLGYVEDIEIDLENGIIQGIIVPEEEKGFGFFSKNRGEYVIKWADVRTIGEDVILVDVKNLFNAHNM